MNPTSLVLLFVLACSGTSSETPPEKEPAKATEKAPDVKFDIKTLQENADQIALVPSPAEMEKALGKAGINQKLADMVTDRDISMDVDNKDQIAVRTGVVLADMILTVQASPKDKTIGRLKRLKEGFAKLEAGDDVQRTIDDLIERLNNDAVSKNDLLIELDELSGVVVPELEAEAGEWVVPVIQAGSWLEGAHLISGAIKDAGKYEAANSLLRQPAVVKYFLKYVQREGRNKAPDEVVRTLEETLTSLEVITAKEQLTAEDVTKIHSATGAVLTLL